MPISPEEMERIAREVSDRARQYEAEHPEVRVNRERTMAALREMEARGRRSATEDQIKIWQAWGESELARIASERHQTTLPPWLNPSESREETRTYDRKSLPLPPPPPSHAAVASNYDAWTRLPVYYFPVMVGDVLVGYLWGSQEGNSAGFFAGPALGIDRVKSAVYWHDRLEDACRMGLTPAEAITYWRGRPGDPRFGWIAGDAEQGEARTIQELALRLNPDNPLGEGPWIQDGTFPSGSPEDRSAGFSAIAPTSTTLPTFPPPPA